MNPVERVVRRIDRFQQEHRPLAFCVAVVRKFGDDRAGTWAAVLAYDAFLAVFPLLLLLTTLLAYVTQNNPDVHRAVLDSALRDFPIIGRQLTEDVRPLHGSALAVAVGGLMLLWGSRGLSDAGQLAMSEVWNVPNVRRPGFVPRLVRSIGFIVALGLGIGLTTAVSGLATYAPGDVTARVLAPLGGLAVNVALFIVLFRVLTPHVATRELVPGAALAGVGWSLLQVLGTFLVGRWLRDASEVYGYFGSVLGLISWLFLAAQVTLYAAELNVVRARRLWPRSLVQPPLTPADREVLDAIAREGRRRPEQLVRSGWKRTA
ncbi:MAG TPA: YihY/virulence factor BrkB family protein [Acidimicrobiales bacterium]|nr:YihY/virulence factor BrkB family protein [Acidimicrobiales bacterium]